MNCSILLSPTSAVAHLLEHDEKSYSGSVGYFQEDFGSYSLEGRILFNDNKDWPSTLFIHGARSDYTEMNALLFELQRQGVSTLSFNLSGHNGTSGISLSETSLQHNLEECERFFLRLDKEKHQYTIIGHSLGGALAGKLTSLHKDMVDNLILFCPAVYSDEAYLVPFGTQFTKAISKPASFLDSTSLAELKYFYGKVVLVMGEYDGLKATDYGKPKGTSVGAFKLNHHDYYSPIPFEVVEAIKNNVAKNKMKCFTISQCDHGLATWLRLNPNSAHDLIRNILQV